LTKNLPNEFNKKYFNSKYKFDSNDGYEVDNPLKSKRISEFTLNLLKNLKQNSLKLLEIGCGYGMLLKELQKEIDHLFATDLSESAIEYIKVQNNEIMSKVNDIQISLPFNQKFDVILAIDVLEHLEDIDAGLTNIKKMMHSQTSLIIEIPLFTGSMYNKLLWKLIFGKNPTYIVNVSYKQFEKIMFAHELRNNYRGTVLELPGITKITKRFVSFTGQHFGEWKLI